MPIWKAIINLSLTLISVIYFNLIFSQTWVQLSDFPSTERDDGVSFVIENMAYCGTGLIMGWAEANDFHAFNMSTDTWSTIASLPNGEERQYAAGFSALNQGFVFGGVNDGIYLNDIWKYDPVLNNWVEKTALPSIGRSGASSFVVNDIAYIIGGRTMANDAINEVWAYDITNDTWQQKGDLPFGSSWRASAVSLDGLGYLLFGKDENNEFQNQLYAYDPNIDTWSLISVFPGSGRSHVALSAFSNSLVFVGGVDSNNTHFDDMWSFNLDLLTWEQQISLPAAGRKGGMCFNNSSVIYYTTGINQNNERLKETWKCLNPNFVESIAQEHNFTAYPNPAQQQLIIEAENLMVNQNMSLVILNTSGKSVFSHTIIQNRFEIDVSEFPVGVYFVQILVENQVNTIKFVKQ